jgi:predicted component of viral defense system (DUF524 family)
VSVLKVFQIIPMTGRAHFAEPMYVLADNKKYALNAYMSYNSYTCSLRHHFQVVEALEATPFIVADAKYEWRMYDDE